MSQQYTLAELGQRFNLDYEGEPSVSVSGVAALQHAKEGELAFLFNPRYKKHLATTKASIVIVAPEQVDDCPTNCLVSDSPYYNYAKIAQLFHPVAPVKAGVAATAQHGQDCVIPASVHIGDNVVLGDRVILGEHVVISPNTVIQDDVVIGDNCMIWPNVTICHGVRIGKNGEFLSGCVIGSDGFGYAMHEGAWHKVPQLGTVVIGDGVSVGANTSIDRGTVEDTVIHDGVKLDNQVQIAHNVQLGKHTVAAGCAGVAGSTKVGDYCQLAGGVGLTGHIEIADQVAISAMSMVPKSITEPGVYSGRDLGLLPLKQWQKKTAILRQADKLAARIKQLEATVATLTSGQMPASSPHPDSSIPSPNTTEQSAMSKPLDINEIIQLIPHRYPFLLVDKVLDYTLGESLVAVKNVSMNEQFFVGHFPQRPVMPGVLMIEALAQAGAVLAFKTVQELHPEDDAEILLLAGVDKARFKRPVEPGDQLRLEVKVLKAKGRIWKLMGTATVNDELACSAEILSVK